MRINKKTITTETKSGRTYVPPRIKLCPLDPESIMAGSPYIQGYATGTSRGQGEAMPAGFEPAPREILETESSTTDVTGLQLFGN